MAGPELTSNVCCLANRCQRSTACRGRRGRYEDPGTEGSVDTIGVTGFRSLDLPAGHGKVTIIAITTPPIKQARSPQDGQDDPSTRDRTSAAIWAMIAQPNPIARFGIQRPTLARDGTSPRARRPIE